MRIVSLELSEALALLAGRALKFTFDPRAGVPSNGGKVTHWEIWVDEHQDIGNGYMKGLVDAGFSLQRGCMTKKGAW